MAKLALVALRQMLSSITHHVLARGNAQARVKMLPLTHPNVPGARNPGHPKHLALARG